MSIAFLLENYQDVTDKVTSFNKKNLHNKQICSIFALLKLTSTRLSTLKKQYKIMVKKASFNKIKFTIEPYSRVPYGSYLIKSSYKGNNVSIVTTDASLYDYVDDGSNIKKQRESRKQIYSMIKDEANK